MNFQQPGWFGELRVSGSKEPMRLDGTVQEMLGKMLSELRVRHPRESADGKQISLVFRTEKFKDSSSALSSVIIEVESQIEANAEIDAPREGETHDDFYDRLVQGGADPNTAGFVAADWFQREPPNPKLVRWLNDDKAVLFRKLNASNAAFESAAPSEYESLKRYVLEHYPEFCERIVFRTA